MVCESSILGRTTYHQLIHATAGINFKSSTKITPRNQGCWSAARCKQTQLHSTGTKLKFSTTNRHQKSRHQSQASVEESPKSSCFSKNLNKRISKSSKSQYIWRGSWHWSMSSKRTGSLSQYSNTRRSRPCYWSYGLTGNASKNKENGLGCQHISIWRRNKHLAHIGE